jgi:hypothetical protein
VITRTFVFPLTVSDNPKGSAVEPLLRKAAGPLDASGRMRSRNRRKELNIRINIHLIKVT